MWALTNKNMTWKQKWLGKKIVNSIQKSHKEYVNGKINHLTELYKSLWFTHHIVKGRYTTMNKLYKLIVPDLDKEIVRIERELTNTPLEEVSKRRTLQEELGKLVDIKNAKKSLNLKPGDILKIGSSLLMVVIVLKHEESNVITSKIWGSVSKLF